ncbi:branched-chain amino acid ABC transporter permease [Haloarcula sp. 1CSR25-25]|uniref:branched-chain amino acid ABC transporter permease n=1 Tax=Haloarcula sp. 1CSR25-25 TaxID=2862545 RepID=UPI002895C093|nr:branched-chain amino acid ABC transporter permease [Haloarcula sp. 1CSR25-25]MDT3435327.1 branched-chain amino acid ABC transporter permease [Haloarcula sp. 1CSR25-25]
MVIDPQFIWNGLVVGSLIALGGLGLTLLFGLLNFINIAYGDYMAFGAYFALAANVGLGLPIVVSVLIGAVGGGILAVAVHKFIFSKFMDRDPIVLLVVSIGMAFILRNVIRIFWSTDPQYYAVPVEEGPSFLGVTFLPEQVAIIAMSLVVLGLLFLLLHRTRIGIAMRAASDDTDLARLRGIDTKRLVIYISLVGGIIAAFAGIMLGLDSNLRPNMGFIALIPIFAAVILGGIGDPTGAVIGGYVIGIGQEVSVAFIPSEYKPVVGLVLLIIGLLTRPDGLFGEATR